MSLNITDIESLCSLDLSNAGGISEIKITDVANIQNFGIAPGSDVYTISYGLFSGQYREQQGTSRAGDYITCTVSCYVPRWRYTMEKIRQDLTDRKVAVQVTDYNGDVHLITAAALQCNYSTGQRPGDKNGYELTFTGVKAIRTYMYAFIAAGITGAEGAGGGSEFGEGTTPTGVTGDLPEACCVEILTTPINYTPAPTSNIEHRNKFVTTLSGDKYYIDHKGDSTLLNRNVIGKHEFITTPLGNNVFSLTNIDLAEITDPATQLMVERNGDLLKWNDLPAAQLRVTDYNAADPDFLIGEHYPLESGDYINIYQRA